MFRYAGYQSFQFGVQRLCKNYKGEDATHGDWSLIVGGSWRIIGTQGKIVSSDDFGLSRERRDQEAKDFYRLLSDTFPLVEIVEADEDGVVRISMTASYLLEILASGDNEGERWRFMPKDREEEQFVITPQGVR